MDIADFQRRMRDAYYERDVERGLERTFLWFVEEVGELSSALNGRTDEKNTEEEFADVFAWLCSLANIKNIDLEAACRSKYRDCL